MDYTEDETLAKRSRDIIAVTAKDLDSVRVEVEEGVAYVEGVVSSADEARAIVRAMGKLRGLRHIVTWLSTETVMAAHADSRVNTPPTPVRMQYHSKS
jgi:hypothetical protein